MTATAYPGYDITGVCQDVIIRTWANPTITFNLRSDPNGTPYSANWSTEVVHNGLLTSVQNAVGATGRLCLTYTAASHLRLGGTPFVNSSVAGHDHPAATPYFATVRTATPNGARLDVQMNVQVAPGRFALVTVDWYNPSNVWTGAETTLQPAAGNAGTVYVHDAFAAANAAGGGPLVATGKWPTDLGGKAVGYKVQIVGTMTIPIVQVLATKNAEPNFNDGTLSYWLPGDNGIHVQHLQPHDVHDVQAVSVSADWVAAVGLPHK